MISVNGLLNNWALDDHSPLKYALLGSTHFLATMITMTIMMTITRNNNNDNDDSSKENDVDNDNYKVKYKKYMCQNYGGPQGTCSKLKQCCKFKIVAANFQNELVQPSITSSAAVCHVRSLRSSVRKASKISYSLYPLYIYLRFEQCKKKKISLK